jgi:hypothetical protein
MVGVVDSQAHRTVRSGFGELGAEDLGSERAPLVGRGRGEADVAQCLDQLILPDTHGYPNLPVSY